MSQRENFALPGVEPGVAPAADHLVAVVLLSQQPQRGLDHTSAQTEHLYKNIML